MLQDNAEERANAAAQRATRAWLFGKSLAAEIDELRFKSEDSPVPAPGLSKLLDRLEKDLQDVCDLSDQVALLLQDPDPTADLVVRIEVEADAAEEGAEETERVARRIAQLALGVFSGLGDSERAQRLDRAAVAVLRPPPASGRAVGLVDDGIELFAHHSDELLIELGGIICRMLVDRNVTVRFDAVTLRVGLDETLHLITPDGDQAWESPVHVSEAVHTTAKALESAGLSHKQIRAMAVAEPH